MPGGRPAPRRSTPARCRTSLAPVEMVGSTVVAPSETEQLTLWIWQAAFRSDTPEPVRQLPVMFPGML